MRNLSLTQQERDLITLKYKSETNRSIKPRLHLLLLKDQGLSQKQIAKILLVTEETISAWLKIYCEKGLEVLCTLHYKGSSPKVSPEQIDIFKSEVAKNRFQTSKQACAWVEETFSIHYSQRAMRDLLIRCGFTRQKAHLIPGKSDPVKQSLFFRELPRDKSGK